MEYFDSIEKLPIIENSSVALGYFDGMHLGHQVVIFEAENFHSKNTVLFTFQKGKVDGRGKSGKNLISLSEKRRLAEKLGIDIFLAPCFEEIMNLEAEHFIEEILIRKLGAKSIACGFNFHFGKNAKGDQYLLKEVAEKNGILLHTVDPINYKGEPISSTRIRQFLQNGDLEEVKPMLGRVFSYQSEVVHGEKLGRELGFPTANQIFDDDQVVPKYGIYASIIEIENNRYQGVTSIGVKPTLKGDRPPNMETFLLDYSGNLYGKKIRTALYQFLRSEQKFESLEDLKIQMNKDAQNAKEILTEEIILKSEL